MGDWTYPTAAEVAGPRDRPTGVLRPEQVAAVASPQRRAPHRELSPWVEHYWSVRWALAQGELFPAKVVSHPSMHVTVETGTAPRFGHRLPAGLVHGVITRAFEVDLSGAGRVFGVRFRPGGFGAFTVSAVGVWTDRVEPLVAALGGEAERFVGSVLECESDEERASAADSFLLARAPDRDPRYDDVLAMVEELRDDATLTSVSALARRYGVGERTVQRLFRRYVGVGPRWVLRRARLHDAIHRIDAGEYVDLAGLATDLGWFDQAHFTRDFTDLVGQSPAAYARRRAFARR